MPSVAAETDPAWQTRVYQWMLVDGNLINYSVCLERWFGSRIAGAN